MTKTKQQDSISCIKLDARPTDLYPFDNEAKDNRNYKRNDVKGGNRISISPVICKMKLNLFWSRNKVDSEVPEGTTKLYKRRFWMLLHFCLCSMLNCMIWIQYSMISGTIECYYGVDAYAVNWTATSFLIVYVILVLPVSWYIDRFGLKVTALTASIFNCLSAVAQCLSVNRDRFPIIMVAQTFASIGDALVMPVPPKLAAVWFGPKEICRATAVGVFGNQFGQALGSVIPPSVVTNNCSDPSIVRQDLESLAYGVTASCFINLFILVLTFQKKPPLPPSQSQLLKSEENLDYKTSLLNLIKNANFHKLLLTYGSSNGVILSLSMLLNQMLAPLYKGEETVIGWMGLGLIIAGFIGSLVGGCFLDRTHKFKEVSLFIVISGLVLMGTFTGCLYVLSLTAHFIIVVLLGFFLTAFFSVGFEFASEITYPEPEGTTAGLMNTAMMIFALITTMVGSYLLQNYGILSTCLFLCANMILACISCAFIKPELRRTEKNMQDRKRSVQASEVN